MIKWQEEMREKFGLDFVIVDSAEGLRTCILTHGANFARYNRFVLIVSFVIGPFSENCYVLAHEEGGDAVAGLHRAAHDEFVVPEDPVEQERFKHRLMATANSLKKK